MSAAADTIAAIATPPGRGGVAVVRVSGPRAVAIAASVLESGRIAEARRVYVTRVLERPGGVAIDQALVFAMPAPHSYTGEDVVEIQCHGGSVVSRRVLESVLLAGARPAAPGEFTKRAFLNGRIDLAQAEAVADLITARSDEGVRLAWSQLDGALSAYVESLRDAIVNARALCEAAIDFPDEDLPELTGGTLRREVGRVRSELERLIGTFERARARYDGARAVIIGKPNVGKSSLLNALAGRERAIVTPYAGTTRDVVEVTVTIDGVPVVIADTAGVHDTVDPVERVGVDRSRAALDDAAIAIAVFDGSRPLDADDQVVAALVAGRRALAVCSKRDLPAVIDARAVAELLPSAPIVELSAVTGAGLADLCAALRDQLLGGAGDGESEIAMYRVRHRDAARAAVAELSRAEEAIAASAPPELIASDLDAAAAALGGITGAVTSEEVLDRVFAEFCIGK